MRADQTDEFEALIDGHEEIKPVGADAIDQERLNFRLEFTDCRILIAQVFPGVSGDRRFGAAGRAGIRGDRVAGGSNMEECKLNGDVELHPLDIGEEKFRQGRHVTWDKPKATAGRAEE